jgi:hypothetical protein
VSGGFLIQFLVTTGSTPPLAANVSGGFLVPFLGDYRQHPLLAANASGGDDGTVTTSTGQQ